MESETGVVIVAEIADAETVVDAGVGTEGTEVVDADVVG